MPAPAMEYASLVDAVREEGDALISALEEGPSMDAAVLTCEGWTVADLAVHVGGFCGFWSHVLCEGTGRPKTPFSDPPAGEELVPWLAEQGQHLVGELEAAPPSTEVWTWFEGDHTAWFVARRCAHELAVHRYDGQSARGNRSPIAAALAVDGIDEIFDTLVTARDRTGSGTGRTLSLRSTDTAHGWRVAMQPDRIDVRREPFDEDEPDAADLIVEGTASDIELTLYHRPTLSPVDANGDYSVLAEWHREFTF